MALAQQTDLILLDEPTTYLDLAHQLEVLKLLYELNRSQKCTIVMVLHDLILLQDSLTILLLLKRSYNKIWNS